MFSIIALKIDSLTSIHEATKDFVDFKMTFIALLYQIPNGINIYLF
jgi:hypothetical protein